MPLKSINHTYLLEVLLNRFCNSQSEVASHYFTFNTDMSRKISILMLPSLGLSYERLLNDILRDLSSDASNKFRSLNFDFCGAIHFFFISISHTIDIIFLSSKEKI